MMGYSAQGDWGNPAEQNYRPRSCEVYISCTQDGGKGVVDFIASLGYIVFLVFPVVDYL